MNTNVSMRAWQHFLARLGPLERLECLEELELLDGNGSAAFSSYSGLELSMDSNVMTMNTDVSTRQGRGSTLGMSQQGRGSTLGTS